MADARKKKKLTQAELGEHLNVTDKAVSKWECRVSQTKEY
ncbi:helix-turn-helix transcriptional regulator [Clostridium paraputrificum]|nr:MULTISPECIES: helix-turn-helix transcriptional regulator [Clostridium]MDB2090663.1 helix-turn-helix transcriptional regulator [Clostridium paraputrificum]MDB2097112.1 helix-turn-helix transcriptional regulator [Clostridium paraputrificum]MDC0802138.1 helix-turn-helix transcriptional regulator [Clostridium paraputrificum]MDU1825125.1 helix-turn-helix transcriptional regulator [Clostridium sp.]MDU1841252.1 helix-turn-helix transcriptional regulator [Clostridium sp.]